MKFSHSSLFITLGFLLVSTPFAARGQQPTQQDAQRALQNDPNAISKLRQQIISSGLTPDQLRARLRAQGYPESLLDQYLGGASATSNILSDTIPANEDVFDALQSLGIADSAEVDILRCGANPDSVVSADSTGNSLGGRGNTNQTAANDNKARNDTSAAGRSRDDALRALRNRCLTRAETLRRNLKGEEHLIMQRKLAQDSGFVIFGLETFRSATTEFDPNLNGPVDASYRFGPGDKLVLILTGDVSASYPLDVTREGFIVIPQVGEIYVNNITLGELEETLYSRLSRVYSGVRRGPGATTHFSITPARLRSNQIFVLGEVMMPGSHRVSGAGTALSALYASGGPTENGSLRQVEIKRAGKIVDVLDVYDYLLRGDASHDPRLQNGDIVFVPPHLGRVRMVGEIVRPATYEIRPTETLADVIRFAGGFTATASRQRIQIERILPPEQRVAGRERVVQDVSSPLFATGTGPAEPVRPGDIIRAFAVTNRVRNRIAVRGDVWQPGNLGLSPGMTIHDAVQMAGGLKQDAYLGQILVTRLLTDSTRLQLRAAFRDTTGTVIGDFPLQEDDEIRVFSTRDFATQRYVAISGAVKKSGRVAYREGMTMRDLVLLAGGLDQSAYLGQAEIARLPEDRRAGQTAFEFKIPLDSSYIFERAPDGRYLGPPGLPAPSGPAPEFVLKAYDNVLIFRQPNWELQRTVVVAGEVKFPGRYSLRSKSERVSDIVARSGGLTPEAYADGVTFYRQRNGVGRIGLDLPAVIDNPKVRDNLLLQDGDSISIPRFSAVVNVTGQVNSPLAVTYVPGRTIDYYIRAAGGPSKSGNTTYAYVTQPNGKVEAGQRRFFIPFRPKPRPGSTVFVPEKDANDKPFDFLTFTSQLTAAVTSFLTLKVLLKQ